MAAVAAVLAVPTTASANYRVGISEQSPNMFSQPAWQALKLKRVRYIVPWDSYKHADQAGAVASFMSTAHAAGQDVLIAFSARSGCYVNGKYSKSSACRAPTPSAYHTAFLKFKRAYPWVKTYAAWNEENHVSQPTHSSPKRAAEYYDVVRKACSGCTVLAADVLDSSNLRSYLKDFLHYSHGRGTTWGLHNYEDVNHHRSTGLATMLKTVPGQVWLTETGGLVTFLPNFKTSTARASSATKYMFQLADKYDAKRSGNRSKLARLYVYRWYGEAPGARFDAGLVNPDGTPRPALAEFTKFAKNRLK